MGETGHDCPSHRIRPTTPDRDVPIRGPPHALTVTNRPDKRTSTPSKALDKRRFFRKVDRMWLVPTTTRVSASWKGNG